MKSPAILILISCVMLFACQLSGQQASQGGILPIDPELCNDDGALTDSAKDGILPIDAPLDNADELSLPDSVTISLWLSIYPATCNFSLYPAKESSVELVNPPRYRGKAIISKSYALKLLRRISDIFIEHKAPALIEKRYIPDYYVSAELPVIKFEIYRDGKTIRKEYRVGTEYGHYEMTYSGTFLELFNYLCEDVRELYESKRTDNH